MIKQDYHQYSIGVVVQVVEQELTEVFQECQQLKEKDGMQVHLGLGIGMQKLHKILTTLMRTSQHLKIVQQEFLEILSTDKTHMV
jgi:hypothetical protein